ncbi:MAG: Trk system potassium transporter TrkA [Flavobacteriales bacterium]|nr:Trk system potassium transporter TrkA [Flavobacteriales bacterium]
MDIVIAGAGEVGYYLAKLLSIESHDIVLIDDNARILERAKDQLDVITIKGNATSIKVLKEADVEDADLLIAVTSSENVNFMVATIGKQLGAKRTIARVNSTEFLDPKCTIDFKQLGIDVMISPEELASKEIWRLIKRSAFTDAFEFEMGKLVLAGIHLNSDAPVVDRTISETAALNPKLNFITVAIQREGKTIVPRGGNRFLLGDHVYFLSVPEGLEEIMKLTGKEVHRIKNVMMLGAGRVGLNTINKIKKRRNIKLIEQNAEKCHEIADEYSDILVINSDGHNVQLLEEENIGEMDAFIAVTGNSETNIMSCLMAKSHGVKKTIALVENMDYINLSQNIGIDTLINKKLIAANNIFRYVRGANVTNIAALHGVDAEVLEFIAMPNSKITQKPVRDLKFPKEAIIGGVIRGGTGHIVGGDFHIQKGDKVVVLAKFSIIKDVEKFF